jgi:hypothetical protein
MPPHLLRPLVVLQRSASSMLSSFVPLTVNDILSILSSSNSSFALDPIPPFLVMTDVWLFTLLLSSLT